VSDLLAALTEARADEVAPPAGALGAAQLTVHLHGGGAEPAEQRQDTLTFHAAAAGRVPVTVAGRERVLWLPAAAAQRIRDAIAAVRTAEATPPATPPATPGATPDATPDATPGAAGGAAGGEGSG